MFFESNKKLNRIGAKASDPGGGRAVGWWLMQASWWGGCGWLVGCMCVLKVGRFEQFSRGDRNRTLAGLARSQRGRAPAVGVGGAKFWHFEVA